LYSFPKILHA